MLAFLDVAAQLLRLLKGQPERGHKALKLGRCPQHENVDSLVGLAIVPQRSRDASGGVLGVPGLEPRPCASLKLFNDAIGDASVNVNAGGLGWFGGSGHCLSPWLEEWKFP